MLEASGEKKNSLPIKEQDSGGHYIFLLILKAQSQWYHLLVSKGKSF